VRARTELPPGLGAGTAYRGTGSDSTDGGASPACAAGGARKAGSGDCALACEVARAAMLPASMKDLIRIRIMVCSFGPSGHLRARARKALFVLADCAVILRQLFSRAVDRPRPRVRLEAPHCSPYPYLSVAGLDQGQEPGQPGDDTCMGSLRAAGTMPSPNVTVPKQSVETRRPVLPSVAYP
jgi:hypothetical protein